jgi:hypothetical protein
MEGEGIENTEKTNTKEKYLRRIGFRFGIAFLGDCNA